MKEVRILAHAKVNLWLRVLARETTGYHSLETLFLAISLADELSIRRGATGVELDVSGDVDTGPLENNLVFRAASLFLAAAGIRDGVSIHLTKKIPSQAGLGGGSSDCASTLLGMNELFDRPLSAGDLLRIGAGLGSDVPFFLSPSTLALAWGRGERILALEPLPPRPVLIAHPGEGVSTPAAFARLAELRMGGQPLQPVIARATDLANWATIGTLASNDLYPPALERIPRLAAAEMILREGGASICLLAGSGASMFGIFDEREIPAHLMDDLARNEFRCWTGMTLSSWDTPRHRD